MYRHLCKVMVIRKNQGNMTPPEEHSKFSVAHPKEMEIHELLHKEFKIVVPKMLRELPENIDKQLSNIRKTIQEQSRFNKDIENMKKNQIGISKLKIKKTDMNFIETINIRLDQTEQNNQ